MLNTRVALIECLHVLEVANGVDFTITNGGLLQRRRRAGQRGRGR